MKLLLDRRADANAAAASGVTPLMEAARSGSSDAVRLMLASGAQINARESARGQTALMWAVSRQHPDIVKVLIENHADVHARTATRPARGALAVEMEAATLFTVAALRGVQAGCLLAVTDTWEGGHERISDDDLQAAVERMARIALAGVT